MQDTLVMVAEGFLNIVMVSFRKWNRSLVNYIRAVLLILAAITRVGTQGEAQMVDVTPKEISKRCASGRVLLGKVFDMVSSNQMAKGDVLTVAKIAGISGATQTSNLIPLCHNIGLTHLRVDLALNADDFSIEIEGEAASTGRTGAEMEALTAISIAGLTVYDMCKAVSKNIQITGKSGDWSRDD